MDAHGWKTLIEEIAPKSVLTLGRLGKSDTPSVWVDSWKLAAIAEGLKGSKFCIDFLENMSAAHMDEGIVLTYFLRSSRSAEELVIRCSFEMGKNIEMMEAPSLVNVWSAAEAYEKEIQDLLGVRFVRQGQKYNPAEAPPRKILPAHWDGFPLRKDFLVAGPEKQGGNA